MLTTQICWQWPLFVALMDLPWSWDAVAPAPPLPVSLLGKTQQHEPCFPLMFWFECGERDVVVNQALEADREVMYAFGIKESKLRDRLALSSGTLACVVKDNSHPRCYPSRLQVHKQPRFWVHFWICFVAQSQVTEVQNQSSKTNVLLIDSSCLLHYYCTRLEAGLWSFLLSHPLTGCFSVSIILRNT